jgi:tetratricopeptide (TPR) repeat protein
LAARYFDESLAILREVLPRGHPNTLSVMNNLSATEHRLGRFAEAEGLERALLEEKTRVLGKETVPVAISLGNLGAVLTSAGRHQEAEQIFRESLELIRKLLGPGHSHAANALRNVGRIRLLRGDPGAAWRMLSEAAEIQRKSGGADGRYWYMRGQAAVAAARLGRRAEAIRQMRLVLEQLAGLREAPNRLADMRLALGFELLEEARAAEAEGPLLEALEARRKSLPPGHPGIAEAECGWGAALAMQGKAEGRAIVRRSLSRYRSWGLALPSYIASSRRWE